MRADLHELKFNINDYYRKRAEYLKSKITMGQVALAEVALAGVTLSDPNELKNIIEQPISSSLLIGGLGLITGYCIFRIKKTKENFKLSKNRIEEYDFTNNQDSDAINFCLDDEVSYALKKSERQINNKKQGEIFGTAAAGGVFTLFVAGAAFFQKYDLATIWGTVAACGIMRDCGSIKAANDTKKLIKKFKESGKAL